MTQETFRLMAAKLFQTIPDADRVDCYSGGWVSALHKHPSHGTKWTLLSNGDMDRARYDMRRSNGPSVVVLDAARRELHRQ